VIKKMSDSISYY
jgi:hypothetical protein